jgi:predicted enzyme related to lactoylglutathione lyase
MFKPKGVFGGFSVNNIDKAKDFYSGVLELEFEVGKMGAKLKLPSGGEIFIYQKDNHEPSSYTMMNLVVDNIDEAVDDLKNKGVSFEMYEGMHQDEKGIARGKSAQMGPDIAWFKDPSGNILSVLED